MASKKKTAKKKVAKKKAVSKKTPKQGRTRRNKPGAPNHDKGGAPKGNQFWMQRSSHGRNPIFATPDQLWEACVEYFQWVEEHPLIEYKVLSYMGEGFDHPVAKMRAMTQHGLYIFLDISPQTWANYRGKEDFVEIIERVENIIYEQKFTGAAADLLNPNIIARDLGLRDGTELTGKDGKDLFPSNPQEMTDEQLARIAAGGRTRVIDSPEG